MGQHFNVLKLALFFNSCIFYAPVALLVRTQQGISYGKFFLLQAVLSVGVLALELPSGFVADKIGYRNTLIGAFTATLVARILMLHARDFWLFGVEAVAEACAIALSSGSLEGYLLNCDPSKDQARLMADVGRYSTAGFIASVLSYMWAYTMGGLRLLLVLSVASAVAALACGLLMPSEPRKTSRAEHANSPGSPHGIARFAGQVARSAEARAILLMLGALCLARLMVNFFYVDCLVQEGFPEQWMTPIILIYSALDLPLPRLLGWIGMGNRMRCGWMCSLAVAVGCLLVLSAGAVTPAVGVLAAMVVLPPLLSLMGYLLYGWQQTWLRRRGYGADIALSISGFSLLTDAIELVFLLVTSVVTVERSAPLFLGVAMLVTVTGLMAGTRLTRWRDGLDGARPSVP
mgnify:FL=1